MSDTTDRLPATKKRHLPPKFVPFYWNPSTGRLCTSAQLIEWYHQPMTEDEKRHGFPYQGGFAGG